MNEIHTYIIKQVEKKYDVVVLDIAQRKGGIFSFRPGQYVMLSLYDLKGNVWQQHAFSICSSPLHKEGIQLAIKIYGEFTQRVATLKVGDVVGISGPYGFFTFNEKKTKEVVFLAGGIGITPFMSAVRYVCEKGLPNKITLLYSNKKIENIVFFEELERISQKCKNIQVVFVLTNDPRSLYGYEKGRIDEGVLKKYTSPHKEKTFSLCGPLGFMESLKSQLEKMGVPEDRIEMERFK